MDKYDSKPGALYRAICVAIVVRIGELTSFIYNLEQRSRSGSPANGEDKVVKRTAAGRRCGEGRRRCPDFFKVFQYIYVRILR